MKARPVEIARPETADELQAFGPYRPELGRERRPALVAVATRCRDRRLIPADERRTILGQDRPDATGESAQLRLDQVADDLVGAPLAGRRPPTAALDVKRCDLDLDRD